VFHEDLAPLQRVLVLRVEEPMALLAKHLLTIHGEREGRGLDSQPAQVVAQLVRDVGLASRRETNKHKSDLRGKINKINFLIHLNHIC